MCYRLARVYGHVVYQQESTVGDRGTCILPAPASSNPESCESLMDMWPVGTEATKPAPWVIFYCILSALRSHKKGQPIHSWGGGVLTVSDLEASPSLMGLSVPSLHGGLRRLCSEVWSRQCLLQTLCRSYQHRTTSLRCLP